jgi:hypothetical protein
MAHQPDDRAAETPPRAPRGSSPTKPQRPRFGISFRWIVLFLALLTLNLVISSLAMEPESRVRVPYSPFFLEQVMAGNVRRSDPKGDGHPRHVRSRGDHRGRGADDAVPNRTPRRSPIPTSSPGCCRRTMSRSTPSRSTLAPRGGRHCCSASGRRSCSCCCSSGCSAGPATSRTVSGRLDGRAPAATSPPATR